MSEILAQLCSDDSIQILLNLTQFATLGTESNLKGFVWSHRNITELISQRQFAPKCQSLASRPLRCCSLDVVLSEYLDKSHNFTNFLQSNTKQQQPQRYSRLSIGKVLELF